jgi:hypothetical protein
VYRLRFSRLHYAVNVQAFCTCFELIAKRMYLTVQDYAAPCILDIMCESCLGH